MIRIGLFIFILLTGVSFSFSQSSQQLFNEAQELRNSGKDTKAIKKYEEALNVAKAENNIAVQMSVHLELAELKDNVVNYKEALDHYKEFSILYKKQTAQKTKMLEDSVSGLQTEVNASYDSINQKNTEIKQKESAIDSLTTEQLQSQLSIKDLELANNQKALELQASKNRRNLLLFVLGIVILASVFIMRGFILKRRGVRVLKQKNYEIIMEQQKSDRLLMNILPEKIAYELKEFNKTTPHHHESATIMFTDFKGFTKFSEKHSPEELVKLIDYYFKGFDKIVEKYHIEKIKTIGDAYMCVCGIPEKNDQHAANMIRAAFEFRDFVDQTAHEKQKENLPYLEMRIGIHSGPLVAGVVGHHKFSYDVWGDAVNVAARMEHASEPGKINVSETVYQQVQHEFSFEYRGELEAKNKGKMKMYFVSMPS
ncbi:MAG: adenylate/guanylate cyclase domain-containing protein [Crocinitomicaceae bacterium]|nr:adenylate/guanylate cyclase domain-containing protein [Crocinitomicaceae bacterium]MBK8925859.1 adenylate/guanylate cyclase domain-containing protein [Crocinitomicaceae bacterium]